jgi:hypothetical protein
MSWFRVDDTLAAHPKTRRAGLAAMGLWTVAGSWSSQQLTEGFIPEWFVATWPHGKKLAAQLVAAGYWDATTIDDEPGWQFHDWTDSNPTAEMEKERRRKARDRQRRLRERSADKREAAFDKALDEELSRSTSRVTYAVSNGAPTRPDPTRPITTQEGGGSHVSSATASAPPRFPDHCQRHADDAEPGPCGDCADARKANRAKPPLTLVATPTQRCLVHYEPDARNCRGCAADRKAAESA